MTAATPPIVAPDLIRGRASDERPLYTTLEGLKSRAKKLKKLRGCTHTQALDEMARMGGYQNFTDARRALGGGQ